MVDGLVRRKVGGEHPPLAPAPQAVEDCIDHLAHVGGARAPTGFGGGDERPQDGPFWVGEIRGVALWHPVPSTSGSERADILPRQPLFRQAVRSRIRSCAASSARAPVL